MLSCYLCHIMAKKAAIGAGKKATDRQKGSKMM
jgi:hypothetical protein